MNFRFNDLGNVGSVWDREQSNLGSYEGEGLVHRVVRATNIIADAVRCGFHTVRFHTCVYAIVASASVDL